MELIDTPRVVMVVRLFSPWIGGMERQAHKLAAEMSRTGLANVRIVTGRWFPGTAVEEIIDGVPIHRHAALYGERGVRGLRKLGAVAYMVSLFVHLVRTRRSYSVIHVHGLSYHAAVCRLVSLVTRRPMIVKLANAGDASDIVKMGRGQHFPGTRFLLGLALGGDSYVALNPAISDELVRAGVPVDRIVDIPNGVEVPPHVDSSSGTAAGELRLVYVGRLHAQKSLDTVLHAFAAARVSQVGAAVLDVVGDGPDRERLESIVQTESLANAVRFHGSSDRVGDFLARADAFVLPSRAEGMSNALLEAMAVGVPGIVSAIPGNTSVVTDGLDGFVFEVGDSVGLATLLARLAADRSALERAGAEARATIKSRFSLEVIAARYRAEYDELGRAATRSDHEHLSKGHG
ncbi:MAG TPA: glycosyltransferase family 4 protein [Acidimicrobiia bacterium]|nr:glycosyltransferase family 4 protein [Acidimicrobiia bacterium]